jgi:CBS domain-containing protein
MRKNDPINHIMTKQVQSVQDGQSLSEVYKIMCNTGVHHVPVLSGQKLVGLVSFTDMMKLDLVLNGIDAHSLATVMDQQFKLTEVMSTSLVTLSDKGTVRDAAEKLSEGDFHSLPVVAEDMSLAGIVTSTDLIRYLNDQY